jgi:hypothetical protein
MSSLGIKRDVSLLPLTNCFRRNTKLTSVNARPPLRDSEFRHFKKERGSICESLPCQRNGQWYGWSRSYARCNSYPPAIEDSQTAVAAGYRTRFTLVKNTLEGFCARHPLRTRRGNPMRPQRNADQSSMSRFADCKAWCPICSRKTKSSVRGSRGKPQGRKGRGL